MADHAVWALETAPGLTDQARPRVASCGTAGHRKVSPARKTRSLGQRLFSVTLLLIWLSVAGAVLIWGIEYYMTPPPERAFSPLHDQLKPSGVIGQGLGIAGTVMMLVGVVMYSLRKRVGWLAGVGKLATWLEIHIFLCTLGPVLVLFHTSFKFGGIISVAFWSMTIVVLSGVFGRYLYGHLPKTIHGKFRSLESLREQQQALVAAVSDDFGLDPSRIELLFPKLERRKARGFAHALALAIRYDFSKRSHRKRIQRLLAGSFAKAGDRGGRRNSDEMPLYVRDSVIGLALAQIQLEQRVLLLEPFQRVFRYWHLLHLPLAGVMVIILVVHVAVAILFGYTWIF